MAVALKANAIIDATELQKILQVTITDSDLYNTIINIASDFIDRFTNRNIILAVYVNEVYDGEQDNFIFLKNYPVTIMTAIKIWDIYNNVESQTLTENTDFMYYPDNGAVYFHGGVCTGRRIYRVSYTAGYALANVPYELKYACALIAGIVYSQKMSAGIKAETIGKYSVTYDKGETNIYGIPISNEIAGILASYKNINI